MYNYLNQKQYRKIIKMQHVFIIGSKSIGQYGGYETFVDKLTEYHSQNQSIKYHIACKASGDGYMDEQRLSGIEIINKNTRGEVIEFQYHNAHVFKLSVPPIGSATAIYYDLKAISYSLNYCKEHSIQNPIFYILACRIGPFISAIKRRINILGGQLFVNPDGHEWKRAKWSAPVKKYWKISERLMVKHADCIVCDSINIEKYIRDEYRAYNPCTTYIAYGAETAQSTLVDDAPEFVEWLNKNELAPQDYYLVVGRFVPENNYETMIREFMQSKTQKKFAIISNVNERFLHELEEKLHYKGDKRVHFVGTVYDKELLRKIRENAFAYFHGHEVGGTNPSLLEALGSSKLNLLLDVGFNREVAEDGALYWNKENGNLSDLINQVESFSDCEINELANKARKRILSAYSWQAIADKYADLFVNDRPL